MVFSSSKTQRGPLAQSWIEEIKANAKLNTSTSKLNNRPISYMCAYKLCRIECAFWGCQSRVEKLISDSVLRHMILMSHRQAWCWQDEYFDLTMDDVRQLELETQRYLLMKMRNEPGAEESLASSLLNITNQPSRKKSDDKTSNSSKLSFKNKQISMPSSSSTEKILAEKENLTADVAINKEFQFGDNVKSSASLDSKNRYFIFNYIYIYFFQFSKLNKSKNSNSISLI